MWHLTNRPAVADDPFELVARHADVGQHPVVKFLQRVDVPLQTLPGDYLLCESHADSCETADAGRNGATNTPQIGSHKHRALDVHLTPKVVRRKSQVGIAKVFHKSSPLAVRG